MPRAARSVAKRARHKKWIKRAKGFRGRRKSSFKLAKEAVLKAGQHAYRDRRKKKTQFRAQWQTQINAAVRAHGLSYSRFIHALREHDVALDRKVLAELAATKPDVFADIIKHVAPTKEKVSSKVTKK